MISLYLVLLASKHPSREFVLALTVEGVFLICWLGFKLLAARRKSAKLKSMVLDEVLFQFRPLKIIQTCILGLLAGTMALALSVLLIDFTALASADLGAFGVARAIYINFPTYRIYDGAHPAFSLELLSGACIESKKFAEAHVYTDELLEIRKSIYGSHHWMYGGMVANLAGLLYKEGRFADAEKAYRESIAICEESAGHRSLGSAFTRLGNSLREQGRFSDALIAYEEGLAMRSREFGSESLRVAETAREMALVLGYLHRQEESNRLYDRVDRIISTRSGASESGLLPLVLMLLISMVVSYALFSKRGLLTAMVVRNLEKKVESAGRNADPEDVARLVSLLELRGDVQKADELKARGIDLLLLAPLAALASTS
ncbi:MAG: tetratricopeptide repeat protein [Candidatus Obscuribacterales bacterium]